MHEYSRVCPTCGEGYNVPMCDLCHVATVAGQPSGVGEPLRELEQGAGAASDGFGSTPAPTMRRAALSEIPGWMLNDGITEMEVPVEPREVGEGLREAANRAYCNYIDKLRTPECLGHEQKLKEGSFGIAELVAHRDAAELLGRHRAFAEAAALAAPAPKPAPPTMLREAAKSLLIECKGVLSLAEKELRAELGNTNVAVLKVKMADLEATLPCSCECWRCTSGGHCVRCDWNERKAAPKPAPPLSEEDVIAVLHDRATCKCQQTQQCALKQDTFVRRAAERKPPR